MGLAAVGFDQMIDSFSKLPGHLLICVLFFLLNVIKHNALLVHDFHVKIRWVAMSGNSKSDFREVVRGLSGSSMVNDVPVN